MDPKFLIIANWKANEPPVYNFIPPENIEVAIAAPYPLIENIPAGFTRAAQDVSQFDTGAETGEVPAKILAELGVKYCLVGHSERRKLFGETNEIVQKKIDQLKKAGVTPIVCARNFNEVLPAEIVMYEPEEAISTDGEYHPATNINEVLADWRQKMPATKFLYGGSVNPEFIPTGVGGLVVGHASLDPAAFSAIINACAV